MLAGGSDCQEVQRLPAIGDGALGFRATLRDVYPEVKEQR